MSVCSTTTTTCCVSWVNGYNDLRTLVLQQNVLDEEKPLELVIKNLNLYGLPLAQEKGANIWVTDVCGIKTPC